MCSQPVSWRFILSKEVPGTSSFAKTLAEYNDYSSPDCQMPMQSLDLTKVCNGDKNAKIKFSCISAQTDKIFNSVTTTLQEIIGGRTCFDSGNGGQLIITDFEIFVRPTMAEYMRSGWVISMVAAIDYTGSNGRRDDPNSLHYLGTQNKYELAIRSVGKVIEPYDLDKSFPVYGFGGIPRHMIDPSLLVSDTQSGVSHCFAINGNDACPAIGGVQGIVDTYKSTLPNIGLGGPTLFAPLLRKFKNYVEEMKEVSQYQILLILTDGDIHDMPETKELLVLMSYLPCSVIIVGVGNADF